MKQLFKVCQKQEFDICEHSFFKKKTSKAWVERDLQYIYAESQEIAIEKYKARHNLNSHSIKGWMSWVDWSKNIDFFFSDNKITNIVVNVVAKDFAGNETIQDIKEHMFGLEFKEWFLDKENN